MKIKCKWMIWWSNHKLYLLLHKLAGLHSAKMAISNWANPSPPPTPSSLSLSCQVMWPKKTESASMSKSRVVCWSSMWVAATDSTIICRHALYKDIHEYHDKMMNIMTFIQRYPWKSWQNDAHDHNWLIDKGVWRWKGSAEPRVRKVTKIQRQSAIIFEELSRRSFTELYFSRSICGKGGNLPTASNKSNSCSSKISTLHSPIPSHNPQFQFSQSGNGGRRI